MEIKFSPNEIQQMQLVKRYLANMENQHSVLTVRELSKSRLEIPKWFDEILVSHTPTTIVTSLEHLQEFTMGFGKIFLKEIIKKLSPIRKVYSASSRDLHITDYTSIIQLEADLVERYPSSYIVKYKLDEDKNSIADQLWEVKMNIENSPSISVEIFRVTVELK